MIFKSKTLFPRKDLPACITLAVLAAFWTAVLIAKYYYLGYFDWDLAFFNQGTWQLTQGTQYSSLFEKGLFCNHSNFIAIITLPFYMLFKHPMALIFLKLLSFFTATYVLYLLARDKLGRFAAVFLMVLYCLYPPNIFSLIYEFHYESLAPGFLVLLFYFFQKNKFRSFVLTAALIMLIQENMPLILVTFGVLGLCSKKGGRIQWGVLPILAGLAAFYALTEQVIPMICQTDRHPYMAFYQEYGNSPMGVGLTIFQKPRLILSAFFSAPNLIYVKELFQPFVYLPLLRPDILFLALPFILKNILSQEILAQTIVRHYTVSIMPFIFIAFIFSLATLKQFLSYRKTMVVIFCVFFVLVADIYKYMGFIMGEYCMPSPLTASKWNVLNSVPEGESVVSTFAFLAPLSSRSHLYSFHRIFFEDGEGGKRALKSVSDVKYALIDFNDTWLDQKIYRDKDDALWRVENFFNTAHWGVEKAAGETVLFKRTVKEDAIFLVERGERAIGEERLNLKADQLIELLDLQYPAELSLKDKYIPMVFYWKSLIDRPGSFKVVISLEGEDGEKISQIHRLGYFFASPFLWNAGEYYKEHYWFVVPRNISSEKYSLKVSVFRGHDRGPKAGGYIFLKVLEFQASDIVLKR